MAEKNTRLCGMMGFAMRAGKIIIGTDTVCRAMADKKSKLGLVILSEHASDGTKKKILTKCEFYRIKAIQINMSTDELGDLLGKTYSPAVIGITDEGFSREISKACGEQIE